MLMFCEVLLVFFFFYPLWKLVVGLEPDLL